MKKTQISVNLQIRIKAHFENSTQPLFLYNLPNHEESAYSEDLLVSSHPVMPEHLNMDYLKLVSCKNAYPRYIITNEEHRIEKFVDKSES